MDGQSVKYGSARLSIPGEGPTYDLHCSSLFGLPYRILTIIMVKPKKELQWRLIIGSC